MISPMANSRTARPSLPDVFLKLMKKALAPRCHGIFARIRSAS
jgi:hypothetical protein